MSPDKISKRILADRLDWIYSMLKDIESLPLHDYEEFTQERRNVWAAESCLRRALEAMLDLGRHIIAKGMGQGVTEYREIPGYLAQAGVLSTENTKIMKKMAGYRNRLVHLNRQTYFGPEIMEPGSDKI
ncbi:MAG TPA: DUF86 domain-containing protein [Desulfohalobiaceae bacterium]|nr:DUF86 domain-containing protein [Desulfohalobiaceae bacterium]